MPDAKISPVTRLIACPTCQTMVPYTPQNPYRPFCSERCKIRDTAQWATESYRIPSKLPPEEEEIALENRRSSSHSHPSDQAAERDIEDGDGGEEDGSADI